MNSCYCTINSFYGGMNLGTGWNEFILGWNEFIILMDAYTEHYYWWTRYPQETTKYWNLTNLFHPEAWIWTFLTFILVTLTLKFASVLGSRIGLNVGSDEVALIPFRLILK